MPPALLVVGCSEQIPDEVRAYRLMGVSSDGALVLSRHGATYSAAPGQVSGYRELLERLLGRVLTALPSSRRVLARQALIRRWNRNWGVEAEDLDHHHHGGESANDNGSGVPFGLSQPTIGEDGSFASRSAVATN